MRRTKEDAAQTREEILQAAEQLFLSRGYESTTLEEIAAAVGMTRGAVHWHFKNKQGLLFALRDKVREPLAELAETLKDGHLSDPMQALDDYISGIFAELAADDRKKGLVGVMIHLDRLATGTAEAETFSQSLVAASATIFEAAHMRKPLVPPWTPFMAATMFTAAICGLVDEWSSGDGTLVLVPDGQNFVRMILKNWQAG